MDDLQKAISNDLTDMLRERRKALGWSQQAIAEAIGVSAAQISRWESGTNSISSDRLVVLMQLYGLGTDDLFGKKRDIEANAHVVPMEGASTQRMREDLPIFGTALGGDLMIDGDAIEQTTLNYGEVIAYAKRPVILEGNAKAYGLYVQGSSMDPVHLDGDLLLAERDRPLRVGDDVVVYLRSNGDGDLGDADGRAKRVLVKRLVRRTGSYVELRQFSPDQTFRVASEDVLHIDRVLRLADLIA